MVETAVAEGDVGPCGSDSPHALCVGERGREGVEDQLKG